MADWRAVLADAVRDAAELCRLLGLDPSVAAAAQDAEACFPLLAPRTLLGRIRRGDPEDPLLLQVLPRPAELADVPGFRSDPLGEAAATICPGLLQKYRGRALMVTTAACAVHCRYCFRRHLIGQAGNLTIGGKPKRRPGGADLGLPCPQPPATRGPKVEDWELALRRIADDTSIREVILSGGDPLAIEDAQLAQLAERLAEIPHLRRLRVHTRLPVMIPQRVTDELLSWLRGTRLTPVMVVQVNHPAEIDTAVAGALGRLVDAGVPVLNQAVLLRGVNDDAEVLAELCERLIDIRAMPYYLPQLDPVAGGAHFEVPEAAGVRLIGELRRRLPGYAVVRYVRETAAEASKEVLA